MTQDNKSEEHKENTEHQTPNDQYVVMISGHIKIWDPE